MKYFIPLLFESKKNTLTLKH